jgi:hypothetical protein
METVKRRRAIRLFLLLSCLSAPVLCFSQTHLSRGDILREVRDAAKRHAESNTGKDSKYALDMWGQNPAGVTPEEILRAYDEEYTKDRKEIEKKDWVPKAGWVVAALLFIGLIFLERLKQVLGKFIDFTGEKLYTFLAGLPWFYRLALKRYCARVIERHSKLKIPYRPDRPLDLSTAFVPLKVSEGPDSSEMIDAYSALARSAKIVVKGSPGSGKSILLRHLALTYAQRPRSLLIRDSVPILVELNRLNNPSVTLRSELARELTTKGFPKPDYFLARGLKRGNLLLLLDGLDEVSASQRPAVARQFRDLVEEFPAVRLIVTCRTQVYKGELCAVVDRTLDIQSFSDQQIRRFLRSWAPDMRAHGKSVDQLMRALLERPAIMLLARNPLMLTIIAWLYTDTNVLLPQSRSEFYRKSTELLLYDWKPEANAFQLVPKQLVLRDLALHFEDSTDQWKQDRRSLDVQTVLRRMAAVLPSLNIDSKDCAVPLLDEIVQRSGLLLAIDNGERYQFAHLTLQEYFAAVALRSDPTGLIERFKRDQDAWREPVKLRCGLDEDATELVQSIHQINPVTGFECLADAQKVNSEVANQIIESMKHLLLSGKADPVVVEAFGSVASSLSDRGRALFKWLNEQNTPQPLEALSHTNLPQAADALASRYSTTPSVRPLLCRLGELAVPELHRLADAGHDAAVDDLLAIGTPGAAEALTRLMWHRYPEIARRSAFAMAALFQSPDVFAALRDVKVEHPRQDEWVWQPYGTDQETSIPVIAARVVALLQFAHELRGLPEAVLDPRLIIPVCAQAGSELRGRRAPWYFGQLPIAELYLKVISQKSGSSERSASEILPDELELIVTKLFERLRPRARWRFLFNHLSPQIQHELVRGITSCRLPNREDWVSIFHPESDNFKHAWHLLWLLVLLQDAVALCDIVYLLGFWRPFASSAVLLSITLWVGVVLQTVAMKALPVDPLENIINIAAPYFTFVARMGRRRGRIYITGIPEYAVLFLLLILTLAWGPAWLFSTYLMLRHCLGSVKALATIGLLASGMLSLWLGARWLDKVSRNHLTGLGRFLRTEPQDAKQ